jgi:bifunctional non-homologous end joining protein LigD
MPDSLTTYRAKRNFRETPEPKGKVRKRKGNSFVIQKHDATRLHYDFRLELDGVLLSWAVTKGPSLNPADKRLAVRTEDHPLDYGKFEGVIPSGYGAGTVILWDNGTWEPEEDPHEGLRKGSLKFTLHGHRLKGSWALVRLKPRPGESRKRENWLLIKHRDSHASADTVAVEKWTNSVESKRTIEQMARAHGSLHARAASRAARATVKKSKATRNGGPRKGGEEDARLPKRAPAFVAPQLAQLRDAPPDGDNWLHEIKFDGYRIIAVIDGGRVRLFTRNKQDWTKRYARTASVLSSLKLGDCTLDGELVALDDKGQGSFSRMQQQADNPSIELVYYVFDLLNEKGVDIRTLPLAERKARLASLIGHGTEYIRYSDHIIGDGAEVAASACSMKLEGVISKRADAKYTSGRGPMWVKSKCIGEDEFVIGGYRLSDKRGRAFRSLLLGEFGKGKDKDKLIYRGRVGTGFNDETFRTLLPRLEKLKRKTSPFTSTPTEAKRNAVWVEPKIVAQVAYFETTPDGHLRHPSYLGLREDKPAKEVKAGSSSVSIAAQPMATKKKTARKPAVSSGSFSGKARSAASRESRLARQGNFTKKSQTRSNQDSRHKAGNDSARKSKAGPTTVGGQRLTSPDKILWPEAGLTKLDLANYFNDFSAQLLPHVKNRPLSIVRCPEGYQGECFFQKHHNPSTPDSIETVSIREKKGGNEDYLIIRNKAGLVGASQIGGMELHAWGSREDRIENPERIVFDLDPDEDLDFERVKSAAMELRDILDSVGLKTFPLLTGGKGIHVIAPIARTQPWEKVKAFARGLAFMVAKSAPQRYIAQASKAKREGRIFLDWLRNERGATAIAPFSPRRRANAPVATPISWKELPGFDNGAAFTMKTIGARLSKLRSDPWKGYAEASRQALKAAAIEAVAED